MEARVVGIPKIAITGKLRSGKSAAARYLEENHKFEIISFGSKLKTTADELFFIDEKKVKQRGIYQNFGQCMRGIDQDIWVKHLNKEYRSLRDVDCNISRNLEGIVIDDLRQPNEYQWALDNGFYIVRISTTDDERVIRSVNSGDVFDEETLNHDTEKHVEGFIVDYDINNVQDIEHVYQELRKIIDEIGVEPNDR